MGDSSVIPPSMDSPIRQWASKRRYRVTFRFALHCNKKSQSVRLNRVRMAIGGRVRTFGLVGNRSKLGSRSVPKARIETQPESLPFDRQSTVQKCPRIGCLLDRKVRPEGPQPCRHGCRRAQSSTGSDRPLAKTRPAPILRAMDGKKEQGAGYAEPTTLSCGSVPAPCPTLPLAGVAGSPKAGRSAAASSSPTSTPVPIPRRTRGQGRTTVVPVRLTPEERDGLAAYAACHNNTVSGVLASIARQIVRGGGEQIAILATPSPELRELATALSRIGVSLNTIARHANLGHHVSGAVVEGLALEVREVALNLRDQVLPWV